MVGHSAYSIRQVADTDNPIEQQGILRARSLAEQADVILLFDRASQWMDWLARGTMGSLQRKSFTRSVQVRLVRRRCCWRRLPSAQAIAISAKHKIGLDFLIQSLVARLGYHDQWLSQAVPFRLEHVDALKRASESRDIESARSILKTLLSD